MNRQSGPIYPNVNQPPGYPQAYPQSTAVYQPQPYSAQQYK